MAIAMNTPMLDGSGRTMPLSSLVTLLRLAADEQIDKIDGAEESRGHDSGVTALAALLNSAALAIEKLALRVKP